jgi:hypothetical protein
MVAALIMAIAVVGLLTGIAGATRNASRLRDYDRVTQMGQLRMNELLTDFQMPLNTVVEGDFDPVQAGTLKAGWRAKLSNFEKPPNPAVGDLVLDRVQLELWWMNGSQKKSLELEGFRQRVLQTKDLAAGP